MPRITDVTQILNAIEHGDMRAAEQLLPLMMDHPNIAKVHDGGTTPTGRPYFVMELVRGVPITQYCDDNWLKSANGHCQQDTDFNGVRGDEALAKLPEAERREWRKLWEEVEELRKRAGEGRTDW